METHEWRWSDYTKPLTSRSTLEAFSSWKTLAWPKHYDAVTSPSMKLLVDACGKRRPLAQCLSMLATHACVARTLRPPCKVVATRSHRCAGFLSLQIMLTLNCWKHVPAMPPLHAHCCHAHSKTPNRPRTEDFSSINRDGSCFTYIGCFGRSLDRQLCVQEHRLWPNPWELSCQYLERQSVRINLTCFVASSFLTTCFLIKEGLSKLKLLSLSSNVRQLFSSWKP